MFTSWHNHGQSVNAWVVQLCGFLFQARQQYIPKILSLKNTQKKKTAWTNQISKKGGRKSLKHPKKISETKTSKKKKTWKTAAAEKALESTGAGVDLEIFLQSNFTQGLAFLQNLPFSK